MKKITEKDLSLDKKVVSNLSGDSSTKDETNNANCATQNCTKSIYEICCDETYKDCPPAQSKQDTCMCPVTDDTLCDDCSNVPGCMTPIPETDHCTAGLC